MPRFRRSCVALLTLLRRAFVDVASRFRCCCVALSVLLRRALALLRRALALLRRAPPLETPYPCGFQEGVPPSTFFLPYLYPSALWITLLFGIACTLNRPPKGVENGPRRGQVAATRLMAGCFALDLQPPRPPYSGGETAMLSKRQKKTP